MAKVYDPSNDDVMDLMVAIMNLVASHQYSKLLSSRIKRINQPETAKNVRWRKIVQNIKNYLIGLK